MLSDVGLTEPLGPLLEVKLDSIELGELQACGKNLKLKKACGVDDVLGEYW